MAQSRHQNNLIWNNICGILFPIRKTEQKGFEHETKGSIAGNNLSYHGLILKLRFETKHPQMPVPVICRWN